MKRKQKYSGGLTLLIMHANTLLLPILTFDKYKDASLTGWGIMNTIHPLRGLCYKS